jgi:hypothetical protein
MCPSCETWRIAKLRIWRARCFGPRGDANGKGDYDVQSRRRRDLERLFVDSPNGAKFAETAGLQCVERKSPARDREAGGLYPGAASGTAFGEYVLLPLCMYSLSPRVKVAWPRDKGAGVLAFIHVLRGALCPNDRDDVRPGRRTAIRGKMHC